MTSRKECGSDDCEEMGVKRRTEKEREWLKRLLRLGGRNLRHRLYKMEDDDGHEHHNAEVVAKGHETLLEALHCERSGVRGREGE
mgnify:CR=1 FL=1